MSDINLPAVPAEEEKTEPTFIAEFETMDLRDLKDKQYLVAVSREDRNKGKFVCTTIHGPYDFYEMCEEVGVMAREHQHHAKVYICEKDRKKKARYLDENTTDYIECHFADIVTEGILEGAFDEVKEYTCKANIVEDSGKDDPRQEKKEDAAEQD